MSSLLVFGVFFPMAGAVISYLLGRYQENIRDYFADGVTVITFAVFLFLLVCRMRGGFDTLSFTVPYVCGMGLCFTLDGFRALYAAIAAFMWVMSTLFSREYFSHSGNRNRYYLFLLLTLGAVIGVFLSADFFTAFLFFELMSFTSYVWVAHDEEKESLRAAGTYLAVAVIGGLVMLMGIFLLYHIAGTLQFDELADYVSHAAFADRKELWAAGICMLFGFGAKAGAFPLHIWLPKAHPVAPAPASALLSGILTKAGMYGILILSGCLFPGNSAWGSMILIIGVCTMVVGAVPALFSVDIKRILACSSVSQIGFILVGVGMSGLLAEENGLAVRGSLFHMVNHSLIKLTLFMAAGVVFMNAHKLNLNDVKGFGRKKPLLNYIFLMGALGIGGVPLWNGYISKTLIHESIVEYSSLLQRGAVSGIFSAGVMKGIEWTFLVSGGLTAAYMLKLYIALFVEKNDDPLVQERYDSLKGRYMNKVSAFALTVSATLLPVMGFWQAGEAETIAYFSIENLKGGLISIGIGVLIYLVAVRMWLMRKEEGKTIYLDRWKPWMDLENTIYRPLLLKLFPFFFGVVCRALDSLTDTVVVALRKTVYRDSKLPHELEEGTAITHMLGGMANTAQRAANATIWKKKKRNVDYEHKYALVYEELQEDKFIIGRSMSFGLLMFCIGLLLTVGYLLLVR